jgi:hypothetical protein
MMNTVLLNLHSNYLPPLLLLTNKTPPEYHALWVNTLQCMRRLTLRPAAS